MRIIQLGSVASGLDMFDGYVDTQTEEADAIEETFTTDGMNAVALFNTSGTSCRLQVTDNDTSTVYYDETVSLIRDSVKDWWDYFFAPVRTGRDIVFYFEARDNTDATITITYTGGTAKCGLCLPGMAYEIGKSTYGATIGISDYSIVTTNDFGVTYLDQGTWAKRARADLVIDTSDLNNIYRRVAANRGVAAVYDFNNYKGLSIDEGHTSADGYQSLIVYGFFEDFDTTLKSVRHTEGTLEVQGLI